MADQHHPLRPYFDQLNEYHCKLASCAQLTAFLIDCAAEKSDEEWHQAGCWLMRDMLSNLAENLPFPALELQNIAVEVAA